MADFHVLIIGAGATGAALAHDLTLRGFRVTVVERGEVTSGTTGRHHGLLHSGARYAVTDPEAARECIQENRILRRIAQGSFEENDGLFVALDDEDEAFAETFLAACAQVGIPTQVLSPKEALALEPGLNPQLRLAIRVPDAVMDAMRLPLRFLATAKRNGARVLPFHEVVGFRFQGRSVVGVEVQDHIHGRRYTLTADLVVNAAGPWAGRVGQMAGVTVPVQPSPGVLVALPRRLTNMVINRLHPPSDGDILLPQRRYTVLGTTAWLSDDPDDLPVPEDHVRRILEAATAMVPAVDREPVLSAWAAARPLVAARQGANGRAISRSFLCIDHAEEGVEGLVSVIGGKATTARLMAEAAGDLVTRKMGLHAACRTRETPLLPHTAYWRCAVSSQR